MIFPKPGKDDYTKLKAYGAISPLSCMGIVIEKVIEELLSEVAKRGGLLSDRQLRSSKGRSAINAAAIMVDRGHAAWTTGQITGVLLMNIKAAFQSVAKGKLVNIMKVRQMDGEFIQWPERFLSQRPVETIIMFNAIVRHPGEAVVLQGSPLSPILFGIYTSGVIKALKEYISAEELSFLDHLSLVTTVTDLNQVITILKECAAKCID